VAKIDKQEDLQNIYYTEEIKDEEIEEELFKA